MPTSPAPALVSLRGATRRHVTAAGSFCALDRIDLDVHAGECLAIVGPSGSGKTTLAHLLTGIEQPTQGEVVVDGQPLHALSQDALAAWRGRSVGIVFQFFQLLPTLTVAENVMLPMDFRATLPRRERRARALANDPALIVADEPTGNLDSATALEVMALLAALAREGKTVVVVTHERELGRFFTRTITLRDGRVRADTGAPHAPAPAQALA